MASIVSEVPAASPAEALARFQARFRFETDCARRARGARDTSGLRAARRAQPCGVRPRPRAGRGQHSSSDDRHGDDARVPAGHALRRVLRRAALQWRGARGGAARVPGLSGQGDVRGHDRLAGRGLRARDRRRRPRRAAARRSRARADAEPSDDPSGETARPAGASRSRCAAWPLSRSISMRSPSPSRSSRVRAFGRSPQCRITVAEDPVSKALLGYAVTVTTPFTYDLKPTVTLKELFVRKGSRSRGIGEALFRAVASQALDGRRRPPEVGRARRESSGGELLSGARRAASSKVDSLRDGRPCACRARGPPRQRISSLTLACERAPSRAE